jgi:hypothetical protein
VSGAARIIGQHQRISRYLGAVNLLDDALFVAALGLSSCETPVGQGAGYGAAGGAIIGGLAGGTVRSAAIGAAAGAATGALIGAIGGSLASPS